MTLPTPPTPPKPGWWEPNPRLPRRDALWVFGVMAFSLLLFAFIVGVLVWGLGNDSRPDAPGIATPATPAHVRIERRPLTQAGADAAAGALLVAWHDVDHLRFVAWDIHRVTGCTPLAVKYDGPGGHTDPRSVPDDISADVVGRAHRGGERLKVWFGCERGTG